MRPITNTTGYQPGEPPADPAQLQRFLREELGKVAAMFNALAAGHLDRTYTAPSKPRDGDVRYLDGTIAPGGVRGIYYYDAPTTTWKPLG